MTSTISCVAASVAGKCVCVPAVFSRARGPACASLCGRLHGSPGADPKFLIRARRAACPGTSVSPASLPSSLAPHSAHPTEDVGTWTQGEQQRDLKRDSGRDGDWLQTHTVPDTPTREPLALHPHARAVPRKHPCTRTHAIFSHLPGPCWLPEAMFPISLMHQEVSAQSHKLSHAEPEGEREREEGLRVA